jgi:hypothetical protein
MAHPIRGEFRVCFREDLLLGPTVLEIVHKVIWHENQDGGEKNSFDECLPGIGYSKVPSPRPFKKPQSYDIFGILRLWPESYSDLGRRKHLSCVLVFIVLVVLIVEITAHFIDIIIQLELI